MLVELPLIWRVARKLWGEPAFLPGRGLPVLPALPVPRGATWASGRHPPEQAKASSRCRAAAFQSGFARAPPSPPGLAAPAIQFIKGVTAKIHLKMKKMQANPFWETLID